MRRNLWVIDLTLLIAVVITGLVLKQKWSESSERERALLRQVVASGPPPALPNIPVVSAATPANYIQVAQMMLFSKDRNPNVILDPPPPPPPPPPMPPLPVAYGVIDIGSGPTAILAEKPGATQRGYRAGEKIGAFKIVAFNNREILLDWDGKPIKKTFEEIAARKSTIPTEQQTPVPDGQAATQPQSSAPTTTNLGAGPKGPGADLGNQTKACAAGDNSPAGTVQDGFKKVVNKTPFGDVCRWEPVH